MLSATHTPRPRLTSSMASRRANSPFTQQVYSLWEGSESYSDQKDACHRAADMVRMINSAGGMEVLIPDDEDGGAVKKVKLKIEFVLGGDYPWVNALLGLHGHMGSYPCNICEVRLR